MCNPSNQKQLKLNNNKKKILKHEQKAKNYYAMKKWK